MQKLQLYVNDTRIDLFKDETVTISQSIQNIKDPAKVFTEFTKSFTIPASPTNNKLFKHYYNFNITGGFDARQKTSAKIELNNIAFKQGYVKLEGVELKVNKPYAYKIIFYGETVSLKDLLADDKLQALTFLNNFDLSYDAATIKARMQAVDSNNAIICPLITSGASNEGSDLNPLPSRLYYNSQSFSVADGNLYYKNSGASNGVLYSDLKYALRVYKIILAIQDRYTIANGYPQDLVFSDDFFNTSNAEFFNLFMWLHRKKGSVEEESQVLTNPSPVTGFGTPLTYTGMANSSGLVITSPYLPTITQRLTLNTSSSEFYTVVIYRNGVEWATFSNLQGDQSLDEGDMGNMDAATYTITIFSTAAIIFTNVSNVGIRWELAGYLPGSPPVGWGVETYTIASFSATASFTFSITAQIPDMKIIDFLSGLFRLFNLTAYYDDRTLLANGNPNPDFGKIKVEKLEDFYVTNVATYDVSEYIDVSSSSVDLALPYKEIDFSYEGTGTILALQYEQLNGKLWAAEEFTGDSTTGGDYFDAPNSTYSIQVPFEHVMYERLIDVNTTLTPANNTTTIQYGYFVDDNREAYIGQPLLFYAIHQSSSAPAATVISFKPTSGTHESLDNYFIPSNSLALAPGTSTININFYEEFNEYTTSSGFSGTLIAENYLSYIRGIFTEKRRITKVKAYLPLKIIYNIKMNDTLVINNQNYKINTISTNLMNGESDIEILNEV